MQSPKRTLCKRSDEQLLLQKQDPSDPALGAKAADRWLEIMNHEGLPLRLSYSPYTLPKNLHAKFRMRVLSLYPRPNPRQNLG